MVQAILLAIFLCIATCADASARVLRLVVGFPPGGPTTIIANHIADALEKELGVTVVVESKPGASGQIAADYVKRQPSDGNTLLVFASTSTLRVAPDEILVPVGRVSRFDFVFAVHGNAKSTTLKEYISRVSSGEIPGDYTTPGAGSLPHLLVEQLAMEVGKRNGYPRLPLTHIPHQGTAAAVQTMIGGHVPAGMFGLSEMGPALSMGMAPLFIGGKERSNALGYVSTIRELGFDMEASGWHALYVKKEVDPAWRVRLYGAVERAAQTIPLILRRLGFEGSSAPAEEMHEIHVREFAQWSVVAKQIGVVP